MNIHGGHPIVIDGEEISAHSKVVFEYGYKSASSIPIEDATGIIVTGAFTAHRDDDGRFFKTCWPVTHIRVTGGKCVGLRNEAYRHPDQYGVVVSNVSPTTEEIVVELYVCGDEIPADAISIDKLDAMSSATEDTLDAMSSALMVLNFSHPFTAAQEARISALCGGAKLEIRTVKVQMDMTAEFSPQIRSIADSAELTPAEWQAGVIINPPALSTAAVLLLAELHGRIGHFPPCIRMVQNTSVMPPVFEVREILALDLQRQEARKSR